LSKENLVPKLNLGQLTLMTSCL